MQFPKSFSRHTLLISMVHHCAIKYFSSTLNALLPVESFVAFDVYTYATVANIFISIFRIYGGENHKRIFLQISWEVSSILIEIFLTTIENTNDECIPSTFKLFENCNLIHHEYIYSFGAYVSFTNVCKRLQQPAILDTMPRATFKRYCTVWSTNALQ